MIHNIKILESFADAVLSGDKTFEIRKNDRGYQKGDLIRFSVVDDLGLSVDRELSKHTYRITYVLSGWGISEGYVALGIQRMGDERMKYGWHKCTEALPDDDRRVLCCTITKKGLQNLVIGYYADGMWRVGMNSNVTHWMELPEPPEVQE